MVLQDTRRWSIMSPEKNKKKTSLRDIDAVAVHRTHPLETVAHLNLTP